SVGHHRVFRSCPQCRAPSRRYRHGGLCRDSSGHRQPARVTFEFRSTLMGCSEFLGNQRVVAALQGALRSGRVPHALLFTGPRGVGKFTLARMFAQAANCERLTGDFCGECDTCRRMTRYVDPTTLITEGLTERGESADAS